MEAATATQQPGSATQAEAVKGEIMPPAADVKVAFDADAKAQDRAKKAYRVDGILYYPRRKSGRLVQQIIELGSETGAAEADSIQSQIEGLHTLYKQVALLLVNDEGQNPDWERLYGSADTDDGLDLEDAREMVDRLMGNSPTESVPPPAA